MEFPSELVKNAVEQLSTLPGIGKRSALRLALHLLKKDKNVIKYLNETEIDKLFNLDQHFVHVDHIFDRVFD